jgi:flagellar motor switch protein FliM
LQQKGPGVASNDDQTVMRRKLAVAAANVAQGGPGADRSWRVILARAARDSMTLGMEVTRLDQSRASLTELLDMPTDRALIAVLEGPGEGLGLLAISAPLLAAMTEMQTIGRVTALAPPPRKPTRTDAAMVAGFVDAALGGLELALADEADLVWAGGFRYASFLDDPRPLGLLLEDIPYRVLRTEISVEGGARLGQILMALPAAGRGQRPRTASHAMPEAVAGHVFAAELAEQVGGVPCVLQAVIHRMACPLSTVIALQVGDVLAMGQASLDKIGLHGLDGQRVSEGRLGQNRGMCAVRLTQTQVAVPIVQASEDVVDLQRVALG